MRYYYKKFAAQTINNKSDEYVWLLYFVFCAMIKSDNKKSLWESLKEYLRDFDKGEKSIDRIRTISSFYLNNLVSAQITTITSAVFTKLKYIQLKNFRGFGEFSQDDAGIKINFDPFNTIFYGPNGSGKSSLCDALEYKITGDVREARKRNRKVNEYVKRIGATSTPQIKVAFENASLDADKLTEEQKFHFSQAFIEKNRIQEFSLFGSKDTNIKNEDILSVLIGMDELTNLIDSLVQPASFKSNLSGFKRTDIAKKIEALNIENSSNLALLKSYGQDLLAEETKASGLLGYPFTSIIDILLEIFRIKKQQDGINSESIRLSTATFNNHTKTEIEQLLLKISNELQSYKTLSDELSIAKSQLNLRDLYAAIDNLKSEGIDNCPACETPITQVVTNPFTKATQELEKLKSLSEKEDSLAKIGKEIEKGLLELQSFRKNFLYNLNLDSDLNSKAVNIVHLNKEEYLYKLGEVDKIIQDIGIFSQELSFLDEYFTCLDTLIVKQETRGTTISDNAQKLGDLNKRIGLLRSSKSNWKSINDKIKNIELSLSSYTEKFEKLNKDGEKENEYNSLIESLISKYPDFYADLVKFKDNEFKTRFGKIETEIAGFYKQINKHDSDHDSIELFKINKVNSEYKVEFKLLGKPDFQDASIKFSEGHLRSLGLSILLANAKINNLAFVIFDDVVNAIDSEHRANIIEMMVHDTYLSNIQQVVSTHDRLYWERFSLENRKDKHTGYVLKCTNAGVLHYNYNLGFREKIEDALNHHDIRQALLYCRIWFETLAKQHCMENNIELKGTLKSNGFHVAIEPTIASIYRELEKILDGNTHLAILKADEINYRGINQEHHSFDEYNFNFVHSRTSTEIQRIFEAVSGLDEDLKFLKNHSQYLKKMLEDYENENKQIKKFVQNTPLDYRQAVIGRKKTVLKELNEFPQRMQLLKIDPIKCKDSEKQINRILLGEILADLSRSK